MRGEDPDHAGYPDKTATADLPERRESKEGEHPTLLAFLTVGLLILFGSLVSAAVALNLVLWQTFFRYCC